MANTPPPPEADEDEGQDAWLVTYADAVTLLMTFFIMLVSFSKIDIPLYEKVAAGIKNELGKGKKEAESPTTTLKTDLQDVVFTLQADQVVKIGTDNRGIVLELNSSAFFKPASADLREQAIPVLQAMAAIINAKKYEYFNIEVEGHTDDDPISTPRFPSNWELSAGRASTVVRFFIGQGIYPEKMEAIGFADTRPKVPNRDADGKPIPDNQALNRRVVIHLSPMSMDDRYRWDDLTARREEAKGTFSEGRPPPKNGADGGNGAGNASGSPAGNNAGAGNAAGTSSNQ